MYSKAYADRVSGAVFLIGLGLLFTGIVGFWPGILFVIGAAAIARGVAEGQAWYNVGGGVWMIGLGFVFLFGFSLPLFLILIGVTMLFGYSRRDTFGEHVTDHNGFRNEKRKNDDFV